METEACDYLVIGAGSAGCVVAGRLGEEPGAQVMVLEAGGSDRRFWIKTPAGYAMTLTDARVNWCYEGRPDPGLNGRRAYVPRGKVVGGSGSINAMAYVRGLPQDFDDWAEAGAAGWAWRDVEPAYQRLERHVERDAEGRARHRGTGPLVVSDLSHRMHPFTEHFLTSARDMGWPVVADVNAGPGPGVARMRSTVQHGRRWSTADAFLRPALRRRNVRLETRAVVERLTFDGRRATGAVFRQGHRRVTVTARRGVVVSAGAINSPKILLLSGLGAPAHLRDQGIAVTQALPEVGQGLQDHWAATYVFRTGAATLNAQIGSRLGRLCAGLRYVLARRGPLSVPINQVSGFVPSGPDAAGPDMQIYGNPMSYLTDSEGHTTIDPESGFLLCVQPCRPTSRGAVRLAAPDPDAAPEILPRALSTNEDCRLAIRAGRLVRAWVEAPTLAALTQAALSPDPRQMDDDALLEDFRARANSIFHASCTCRMGRDAGDSVLDSRLRVHGVEGLRVIDASAFPNVTSGNTNAPTIMLAERGAAMIREDAKACA